MPPVQICERDEREVFLINGNEDDDEDDDDEE